MYLLLFHSTLPFVTRKDHLLLSLGVNVVVAVVGEGAEGGREQLHHAGLHTAALRSVAQSHHAQGVARLFQSQLSTAPRYR